MNLPIEDNRILKQGYTGQWNPFFVPGDYSEHEVILQAKASESLDATPIFQMSNDVAGGSDESLTAVHLNGRTKIIPTQYYSDTVDITQDFIYYEIIAKNESERVVLVTGVLTVDKGIIKDGDIIMFANLSHKYIFKITPPSTVAVVQAAKGFDGTLSVAVSGDEVTITSTEDELTEMFRAEGKNIRSQRCIDVNTYKIWLADNWETEYTDGFTIDFFKQRGA